MAHGRRRLRALLWFPRRGDGLLPAGPLPGHHPGRAAEDAGGGLPLRRRHRHPHDRMGAAAEGADAGQAVLRLPGARRHARTALRAQGMVGQIQGQVRPGLGQAARRDLRPPEAAGRHPRRCRAHRATEGNPGLGGHAGRAEACAGAADGGLRRLHGAHRLPGRPCGRRARRSRRSSTTR